MRKLAVKIAVYESEAGWGLKLDDWMVCLTTEDSLNFKIEFNSKNTAKSTPNWYMYADGEPRPIDLTERQYGYLLENKRVWLSQLNKLLG